MGIVGDERKDGTRSVETCKFVGTNHSHSTDSAFLDSLWWRSISSVKYTSTVYPPS